MMVRTVELPSGAVDLVVVRSVVDYGDVDLSDVEAVVDELRRLAHFDERRRFAALAVDAAVLQAERLGRLSFSAEVNAGGAIYDLGCGIQSNDKGFPVFAIRCGCGAWLFLDPLLDDEAFWVHFIPNESYRRRVLDEDSRIVFDILDGMRGVLLLDDVALRFDNEVDGRLIWDDVHRCWCFTPDYLDGAVESLVVHRLRWMAEQ